MNKQDFATIERELEISVPAVYRQLMLSRADELREAGCFDDEISQLYRNAGALINSNRCERDEGTGADYAFPGWWKTFLLIGTNGGGDYYSVRLDNSPGVWMIGTDCGDEPTLIAETLNEYVDQLLAGHRAQLEQQAEVTRRRLPYQPEIAAHRDAITREEGADDAVDWLECTSGYGMFRMLNRLPHKVSPRRLRLYGIACCRLIPDLALVPDCAAAIELAERMTTGKASDDEVAAMRDRMRELLEEVGGLCGRIEPEDYRLIRWRTAAAYNLYQADDDYLQDAPIHAGDPRLAEVYNAVSYALYGAPYGSDVELDLLREVLGNPFLPVRFDPQWRSPQVITLAEQMYESQEFEQMPALAELLADAGCSDARVMAHCRREAGHVRGCWVLDAILEKEPDPGQQEFQWDFHCHHPAIDAAALKAHLVSFGTAGPNDRYDDAAMLALADWLEVQGDTDWADYIRVRCAADGRPPGEDYIDLLERQFECAAGMRGKLVEFENIYFSGYRFASDIWWGEETDDLERGLPMLVHAVIPGQDAGPAEQLIQKLQAMTERTPIRGINFGWDYAGQMGAILDSPGGRALRYLAFENRNHDADTACPVLRALAGMPDAPNIERLSIQNGIKSDSDALALASAPLHRLHRLDMQYGKIACSAAAAERLMTTPWFTQLGQLYCGFGEECGEVAVKCLSRMPRLHSLALSRPPRQMIAALADAGEFTALRRLCIQGTELTGDASEALCRLQAPDLVELWLDHCAASEADVAAIVSSPLFNNLRAVSFGGPSLDRFIGPQLNEASLELLARSRCASRLRVLRLLCGDHDLVGSFSSLGTSALAGEAFCGLTTLQIEHPYTKQAMRDTGRMLHGLRTPNLRHLTLVDCSFDDECAAALAQNPCFANLTRLHIDQGYDTPSTLSQQATEAMLRSPNLQHLVQIELSRISLRDTVEILADGSVLPALKSGVIGKTRITR